MKIEELNNKTPIEKSALALLKIHQLIEHSYGGNVSNIEFTNNANIRCIDYSVPIKELLITDLCIYKSHIAFHTEEQAEDFLSRPENVQLLKDYFMI